MTPVCSSYYWCECLVPAQPKHRGKHRAHLRIFNKCSADLLHLFSRSSEDFQRRQLQVSSLQNWPSRAKGTKRHQAQKLTAESAKAPLQRCQPSKHQRCPRKSQQNAGYGWPGWLRRYGAVVFKEQPATAEHGKTMQNFRWSLLMSRKTTATLLVSNEATSMAIRWPW